MDGSLKVVARWGSDARVGATYGSRPLVAYIAAQVTLLIISASVGAKPSLVVNLTIAGLGTAAFTWGVLRRRPQPIVAWRLILVSSWLMYASAIAVTVVYGFDRDAEIGVPLPVVMSALSFPVLVVGLVLLWRPSPDPGPADVLDAIMTALVAFLLLWVFAVDPNLSPDLSTIATAVGLPIGCLLLSAIVVKLVLGGAVNDPAVRILLVSVLALLATYVVLLVPGLASARVHNGHLTGILACIYYAFLGLVGLHPRLAQRTYRVRASPNDLPTRRLLLFAALVVVPPVAWAVEMVEDDQDRTYLVTVVVPVAVSALFLLLMVSRLALITKLAQQRAQQLGHRTIALAAAVAEQEELQRQLTYRGLHDPLTGLSNRIVLADRMKAALARPNGTDRLALLLLDLDGFKDINDTLGHPVGDEVLVEVSHRLGEAVPPGATLARLGGDEFAVLLEEVSSDEALHWADALLEIARRSYPVASRELFLTTSIGLCNPRHGMDTPEERLRDADLALYAAKSAGKNCVVVFETALRRAHLDRTRIRTGLHHALVNEEFVLHYQPVVELETNAVVAVEALLRWRTPDGLIIAPREFVPIAEETGMIIPIGRWVLRQACHDVRRWYDEHGVSVSINVSGRQLDDAEFVDDFIQTLVSYGIPGAAIIIEITETSLVAPAQSESLYASLQRLRTQGIRVAIDDFGTGYSSLSYVVGLPIDIVKIDRAFTQGRGGPGIATKDWAFTQAILQIVDSLRLQAIAEGVETPEQAEALRIMRCPFVQGFEFAGPASAATIDEILGPPGRAFLPPKGKGPSKDAEEPPRREQTNDQPRRPDGRAETRGLPARAQPATGRE